MYEYTYRYAHIHTYVCVYTRTCWHTVVVVFAQRYYHSRKGKYPE